MRRWIVLVAAVTGIVLLALLAIAMGRGMLALLGGAGGGGEADPMFAEPAEAVTRPPELDGETPDGAATAMDASDTWVYEAQTPVDMTAEEHAGEQP